MPSEPELAEKLGVSRATLREAMRIFETQGLIHRRQGSGTYVTPPSKVIESGLEVLESIETLAKRIGLSVTMGEQMVEKRPGTDEERRALRLSPGEEIIYVSRVISAEGRPVAYLIDTLPVRILSLEEFNNSFTGSVFDLLKQRGSPALLSSRTEITAATASAEIARWMGIQRNDVLLHFTAILFAVNGEVVDFSKSYFLPGYFRFHVVRRVHQAY